MNYENIVSNRDIVNEEKETNSIPSKTSITKQCTIMPRKDSAVPKDFSIDSNSGQKNLTEIILERESEFM